MTHAEIVGLTSRDTEKTFEQMLAAIGDNLSDLQIPTMGRKGKMRMMKRWSRAS
jgi:hypothetical protein